jgi:hypothetical protein
VTIRPVLVALLALPLVPAPAHAATKPVCKLVTDAKGDASPIPDDTLDLLSADISSDYKRISAVIRLAGPPKGTDPLAPSGRVYTIEFVGQGAELPVAFTFVVAPTGTAAMHGHTDPQTGSIKRDGEATYKLVENEVRMTTSLGSFSGYGKFTPKAKITDIQVTTGRMLGAFVDSDTYGYTTWTADRGTSGKTYVAGSKSCLKVGG